MRFKYGGKCYEERGGRSGSLWRVDCATGADLEQIRSAKKTGLRESVIVELHEARRAKYGPCFVRDFKDGSGKYATGHDNFWYQSDKTGELKLDSAGNLIRVNEIALAEAAGNVSLSENLEVATDTDSRIQSKAAGYERGGATPADAVTMAREFYNPGTAKRAEIDDHIKKLQRVKGG